MTVRTLVGLFAFTLLLPADLYAKNKKSKSAKDCLELIEAYTRKTEPGMMGGNATASSNFVIVWKGKTPPEYFFWKGSGETVQCKIEKAHKIVGKPKDVPAGIEYYLETPGTNNIRSGDTVMLTSMAGGKDAAPASVLHGAANTLFYKTPAGWLSYPVMSITKKRAIAMP